MPRLARVVDLSDDDDEYFSDEYDLTDDEEQVPGVRQAQNPVQRAHEVPPQPSVGRSHSVRDSGVPGAIRLRTATSMGTAPRGTDSRSFGTGERGRNSHGMQRTGSESAETSGRRSMGSESSRAGGSTSQGSSGGHRGPQARTRAFRDFLKQMPPENIADRCRQVIDFMATLQLDIALFLYYISWNLPETINDPVIQYARTALMQSEEFVDVLHRWWRPPREHNRGTRTKAARIALEQWAISLVNQLINSEMRKLAPLMRSRRDELTEESLLAIRLDNMVEHSAKLAPAFWSILRSASCTPLQVKKNTYKNPTASILMMISMASFNRSHHRCKLQKLNSIYLKASGLSAKANDTTHMWGLTMSQKWVYDGIEQLSNAQVVMMLKDIKLYPFFGSHDNLNLGFKVYEQRLGNQNHFDSGTAATIYVVKDPAAVPPDPRAYYAKRAVGAKNPIGAHDILKLDQQASARIRTQSLWRILKMLIETPAFSFGTYQHKSHHTGIFSNPPPVDQLPVGSDAKLVQYMLRTVHIEESSQEGNRKCLEEWLKQIDLSGDQGKQELALKKLLVWIGDQLTVSRIRSIKKDRCFDLNTIERFDEFMEIFGWFHAQIAQEHSFHDQYYLPTSKVGLKPVFDLLKRKGLHSPSVQGTFHHNLQEGLIHVAEAHFRDLWQVVSGVDNLSKLRDKSPSELFQLATQIYEEYASTKALVAERNKPRNDQDDYFIHNIQFCRDILEYLDLNDAMRTGDVGRMEDLLPRLLFRFHGGSNTNYAIETWELLQGLQREWPPELRSFVMRYCWLANTTGRPNAHAPFDMIQEHNIRDIKYIFMVLGPFATWEYIKKISPSIPAQRKIKDHLEEEFNHFRRGKSHTSPDKEADVARLHAYYHETRGHRRLRRHLKSDEKVKDVVQAGGDREKLKASIGRWVERRVSDRSTTEDWEYQPPR